jgi:anaerobic selenocysteine-containing dehydrogenase
MRMKNKISRRNVLKGLAALPVIAVAGYHASASAAPKVTADDAVAKALAYTDKSTTAGQSCANCKLYQGGAAASGPCPLFPGKEVTAAGWCKSWVTKG